MRFRAFPIFATALSVCLAAAPTLARQDTDPCLMQQVANLQGDPYSETIPLYPGGGWGGNSCTANDITIKEVAIGAIIDGCANTADTAQVVMSIVVELSGGGGSRYDIGAFLNLNGGSALTGEDACTIGIFDGGPPPEGSDLDLDACRDTTGTGLRTALIGPVTMNCADNILPTDGVVDFSGCVGYDINAGRVCTGTDNVRPANSSKCGCSDQTVPGLTLPELSVTKSCSPAAISVNQAATCTVTVTNSSTLAAADYTGYVDTWDSSQIVVSEDVDGPRAWIDGVRAHLSADSVDVTYGAPGPAGGNLTWKPGGDPATAGNIPAGTSTTLTYEVQIADPNNPPVGQIDNTVCAWQLDRPAPAPDSQQGTGSPFCATASLNYTPSAAVITSFDVTPAGNGNLVEWETGAETGTLALQLERRNGTRDFVPVGDRIDTLEQAPQGATYSVVDPGADADATYRIVEVEAGGLERVHDLSQTPQRIVRDSRRETVRRSARSPVRVARQPAKAPRRFATSSVEMKGNAGPSGSGADRAVIEVSTSGIQTIGATQLADVFGLQANEIRSSLRTERFHLHRDGHELAWWTDQGAGALYFHGTVLDNIDSRVTAYWLDLDNGRSARSVQAQSSGPVVSSFWHGQRFEENTFPNVALVQDPSVDFWFWSVAGQAGTTTLPFEIDQARTGTEAELEFEFFAHQVRPGATLSATLNGQPLGSVAIGSGVGRAIFQAPPGVLQPGANAAKFTIDANTLALGADALTVRYERTFEAADGLDFSLTTPTSVRLTGVSNAATLVALDESGNVTTLYRGLDARAGGVEVDLPAGRFVVADTFATPAVRAFQGNLVADTQSADLIIVAHPRLLEGAQAFADYRAQQGLDVVVKTTVEVFDQYGHSEFGPDAIRRFAESTYDASGGDLQALFLIGSGTFDGRSLRGFDRSLVPTALRGVSWGLLSSDRWFVDFDDNGLDEVAVGRLPAGTNAEVLAYLDRVQAFEAGGVWTGQDLLLADNGDGSGDFPADSDQLAPLLRTPQKIYLGQTHTLAAARDDLLDAWRDGRRVINYYGHGGVVAAAHEGLLSVADFSNIGGAASNPLFLGITCNIARFDIPAFPGLGEEMVLAADGAVAVWASAGLSTHSAVVGLSGQVVDALDDFGGQRLGEAIRQVTAAAGSAAIESGLTLLGDPMIRVP